MNGCRFVQVDGDSGKELASIQVDDCAFGPHDIRGCSRNDIVRELAAGLPTGSVIYNAACETISISPEGICIATFG